MAVNKLLASNGVTALVVGTLALWFGGHQPEWLDDGGEVDMTQARVSAVNAICELGATARQAHRNAVNEGLEATGNCSVAHCAGDPPAACPIDTRLSTGEPAALPVDELVEKEKLKDELREEIEEEVKVEAAVAAEAEASEKAADEQ